MGWWIFSPINFIFDLIIYLIIDNITKFLVSRTKRESRLDILIYESMCLGFAIGFLSLYYYIPYVLIGFLFIHLIGTIYSERKSGKFGEIFKKFYQTSLQRTPPKVSEKAKPIPKEYRYNYHLKPSNDIRLQQSSLIPRPGIFNHHGTTCSLNALLQSFASLNSFYFSLQRNINFSRFNYDPIVSSFVDLLAQLHNEHRTTNNGQWTTTALDTSALISSFNQTYPDMLTKRTMTDICELFQCLINLLNDSLSKQSIGYSQNVIEQVQNSKLTTYSLIQLNDLFAQTESELYNKIALDNLDAQASYIVQYVDLTWLLHHSQLGSIIKQTFSGQILHAHCCENCSHVRFRAESFQILPIPISTKNSTIEKLFSQLTKVEMIESISCSNCANPTNTDSDKLLKHNGLPFNENTNPLSPITTSRRPHFDRIYSSTPISSSNNHFNLPLITRPQPRIKSQIMLGNFPAVLCIQLKRFSFDRHTQTARKLKTSILIEPDKPLDLSALHYTTWLGLKTSPHSSRYRLMAICLHLSDNELNGHSVCLYRTEHQQWFLSDDELITEIKQIDHLCQTSYVTENCYLLFYQRCF